MQETLKFLSFSDPNVQLVVLGCMILGASSALVGSFAFLRKRALIGDAIAHAILPGVCLSFMVSGTKNPLLLILGAFVSGWLGLILIDAIQRTTKLKSDAAIAIILSVFFGVGILLLTSIQSSGNAAQAGLDKFLFGQAAAMNRQDVYVFAGIGLLLIIVILLFFRAFKLIAFNPEYANAIGLPVKSLEVLLSTLTVLAVATGIQAVGVVLMAALLITPASGARFWTDQLPKMIFLATCFGALSAFLGAYVSYVAPSMPTGPWVVMFLSIITVSSIWFAPKRGLFFRLKTQRNNQRKILMENILKVFYHLGERSASFDHSRTITELSDTRWMLTKEWKKGLNMLLRKNWVRKKADAWIITQQGLVEAQRIVRLHRLWEMYLNKRLKLAPDHVHNDAEAIEHIITPEIELQLEKELDYPSKDPHESTIPYAK